MTERTITFKEPWGRKSWLVIYDGPYANDRPPHVEVGADAMKNHVPGETHVLRHLHVAGRAVMWDIDSDNLHGHFTVYFGSDARQRMSEFQ